MFDLSSDRDSLELVAWARLHWGSTIKKSIENQNPAVYHDCCFSFSRRGFSRKAGHPRLQSYSIHKLPSLKEVRTAEEFTMWLRSRMKEHQDLGRQPVFPSINCYHIDTVEMDEEDLETEYLAKRCSELLKEKDEAMKRVQALLQDNQRLHASTKTWMLRYHESLSAKDPSEETMELFTPKKA